MRDDKFLREFFERLQETDYDTIREAGNGIITESEADQEAIMSVLNMLGLKQFVSSIEKCDGPALEYLIVYDEEASKPEECDTEGKPYVVEFWCGECAFEEYGYESAEDACDAAANFDVDENCDLAQVYRRDAETGELYSIMWNNDDNQYEIHVDRDDPDYEVIVAALKDGNYEVRP